MFFRFCSSYLDRPFYEPPLYAVDDSYIPYILSDGEMEKVIDCVDNYKYGNSSLPYIQKEFPIVIRLLDSSGFRVGELLSTKMTEVDLDNGILKMVNTKSLCERLVPLEVSMAELLCCYCKIMGLQMNTSAYLFPGKGILEPLTTGDIYERYQMALVKAGIRPKSYNDNSRGPCLHDLRHRFTFRAIKQLLSLGTSWDDIASYLSTYLGHSSIKETEHYMKFYADCFPEELGKFAALATPLMSDDEAWNDWL